MSIEVVKSNNAPKAIGPYSQAVIYGGLVFCSGQIPLDIGGEMVDGGIKKQAEQVMKNLKAVIEEAGSSMDKVLKSTIFLTDLSKFSLVNEIYEKFFSGESLPARSTVEVSALPKGALIEIEVICFV